LKDYDYSLAGAYFVTVCACGRQCLFGEIADGTMRLNRLGTIVQSCWHDLPTHYPHLGLDAFVVMPNHVHGIIVLTDSENLGVRPGLRVGAGSSVGAGLHVGAGLSPAPTPTGVKRHGLPELVRAFKAFSTRRINELWDTSGQSVWQRNYYEHIIRSEKSLDAIRQYIEANPTNWSFDLENPANIPANPR